MDRRIGQTCWAIAEGYIPGRSNGPEPQMTSHETACLLNASDQDAHVQITLYFSDREPVGPYRVYRVTVPARRTRHLRFNDLAEPEPSRATPTTPACSSRTCRSSCSTPGWTPGRASWR